MLIKEVMAYRNQVSIIMALVGRITKN